VSDGLLKRKTSIFTHMLTVGLPGETRYPSSSRTQYQPLGTLRLGTNTIEMGQMESPEREYHTELRDRPLLSVYCLVL
jgi:hypothetical protein